MVYIFPNTKVAFWAHFIAKRKVLKSIVTVFEETTITHKFGHGFAISCDRGDCIRDDPPGEEVGLIDNPIHERIWTTKTVFVIFHPPGYIPHHSFPLKFTEVATINVLRQNIFYLSKWRMLDTVKFLISISWEWERVGSLKTLAFLFFTESFV